MPSRRQLNRLVNQNRRERQRGQAHDTPTLRERPAPRTPPGDIHPLLADDPVLDPREQEQQLLGTLLDLEQQCAGCCHEYGFHRFIATGLPLVCGYSGCDCQNFQETPMLSDNPVNPFEGLPMGEPPDPDFEPDVAPMTSLGAVAASVLQFSRPPAPESPQDEPAGEQALTPVNFPMLARGARVVPVLELQEPARRVAELVEALQPVLAPPDAIAELATLVQRANALTVTDAASFQQCTDLYELLAEHEKGLEQGAINQIKAFFHRPWKVLCEFQGQFLKPVVEAKKRLSDVGGAWKLAEERRAQDAANAKAREEAEAERTRLREIADRATAKARELPASDPIKAVLETAAVQATEAVAEVTPIAQPVQSMVPSTPTKGRKKLIVDEANVDADAFYRALLEDPTRRVAAPIDFAYLNRQVTDLGEEVSKRFPGITTKEKGGLTAGGRR